MSNFGNPSNGRDRPQFGRKIIITDPNYFAVPKFLGGTIASFAQQGGNVGVNAGRGATETPPKADRTITNVSGVWVGPCMTPWARIGGQTPPLIEPETWYCTCRADVNEEDCNIRYRHHSDITFHTLYYECGSNVEIEVQKDDGGAHVLSIWENVEP
jgi:hypothetical protein